MAFSDGFNNTFRSLDSAIQWRSAQKENTRQFDETLGETKRVNDSRIDVNAAQVGRLNALTQQVDQLVEHNDQMNPHRVDLAEQKVVGAELQNTNRQHQNTAAALTNEENRLTSGNRVAATNAKNALAKLKAKTGEWQQRGANSREVLETLRKEDGTMLDAMEIAGDPQLTSRVVSILSASSHVTGEGFGEDSIGSLIPDVENGQLRGYYAVQESAPGAPIKYDPDELDENGEPRLIPVEEAGQIIGQMVEHIDQRASLNAEGGSARQGLIDGKAREQVEAQMGEMPTGRAVPSSLMGIPVEDLQIEQTELSQELQALGRELKSLGQPETDNGRRPVDRRGRPIDPVVTTPEETERQAQLEARGQELERRLGDITEALQARAYNDTVPERQRQYQQQSDQATRALGGRVRRDEVLNGENFSTDELSNTLATGRTDRSLGDVRDDFDERVETVSSEIADTAVGQVYNSNTGKWSKEDYPVSAQKLKAQIESMAYTDPAFKRMVGDPKNMGLLRQLGINAVALSGGGGGEPNLKLAYQLFQENVDTRQLGNIMQTTLAQVNRTGEKMDPDTQAVIGQIVAEEMRKADPDASPEAISQRAVIRIRNGG